MPHARLNDIDLHWGERGTGDVLLFLHGFPFDRRLWDREIATLPAGWRAIAPDLRGFGASRDQGSAPLTMTRHAQDVIALLDHLQIARALVCGLSMGGYVAFELLRAAPDRLRGLILCDTRAEADGEEGRRGRRETAERVRREGVESVVDTLLPKLLAESTMQERPEVGERLAAIMASQSADAVARASLGMAERQDARTLLADIAVPTLVVAGADDALIPPDVQRALAAAIPGARLALLPEAGHVANLDNPAAFGAALHGFLATVRTT